MDKGAFAGIISWVLALAAIGCFIAAIVIGTRAKKDEQAKKADKTMAMNLGIATAACGAVFLMVYFGAVMPHLATHRGE